MFSIGFSSIVVETDRSLSVFKSKPDSTIVMQGCWCHAKRQNIILLDSGMHMDIFYTHEGAKVVFNDGLKLWIHSLVNFVALSSTST